MNDNFTSQEFVDMQRQQAAETLWEYLRHGDDNYQNWLRESLYAFFRNEPRPVLMEGIGG